MSIDLHRVVQLYEQSSMVMESKAILLRNLSLSGIKNEGDQKKIVKNQGEFQERFHIVTEPIADVIARIVELWKHKVEQLQKYDAIYTRCSKQLKTKANQLKNNTSLLTKQQQLISTIQQLIQTHQTSTEPLEYFDINHRTTLHHTIKQKLKQIEQYVAQTKQSRAPMYMHKIEKQLKNYVYDAHRMQTGNDQNFRWAFNKLFGELKERVPIAAQNINGGRMIQVNGYLQNQMHKFFQENSDAIEQLSTKQHKNRAITQKYTNRYFVSLNIKIKLISSYWNQFLNKFHKFTTQLTQLTSELSTSKEQFEKTQQLIYKNLENIPNEIGRIFQVEVIFNCIKKFQENFQLNKLFNQYYKRVGGFEKRLGRMLAASQSYAVKVSKQINLRGKNFKKYLLEDKAFFQQNSKAQNSLIFQLIQITQELLHKMYNIIKNILKLAQNQRKLHIYQQHEINRVVNKLIIQQLQPTQTSQHSTLKTSSISMSRKRYEKSQKILKIQKFLETIFICDKNTMGGGKQFAVALGPRFLLHGKILINQIGIYYQSVFNKKNVFFGKTKIFIQKDQILEVDQKNTLLVFPDAIEIKTSKGPIYFHALGSRKAIYNALIDQFFPQNNREDAEYISEQGDFQQIEALPNLQIKQNLLQPLQTLILQKQFSNCKLNRFFRRYFSDDSFEIRGKVYENFKTYFLQQIQAMEPKSTQLTPQPPAYFMYKNQSVPETASQFSERLHTYKKAIPKIPFISKGGDGFCEDRQTYYWLSPEIIVIDSVSVVKGFSLTQGMQVLTKTLLKQQPNSVKIIISGQVNFSTQSSTNSLLRTPALANLKSATLKMSQIIEKYQKGKKGKKSDENKPDLQDGNSNQKYEILTKQNQKLRKQMKYLVILFVVFYVGSMVFVSSVNGL